MNIATLLSPRRADAPPHVPIAERLSSAGFDLEELARSESGTRRVVPVVVTRDGGEQVAGMIYQLDYRAEEEYGCGDLVKALTGTDSRNVTLTKAGRAHTARFADVNAFALSTRPLPTNTYAWGEDLRDPADRRGPAPYAEAWDSQLPYVRRDPFAQKISHGAVKMADLRARAKALGLTSLPTTKKDLSERILNSDEYAATITLPDTWPAWFHFGTELVVRADSGASALIVDALGDAIDAGALAITAYSGGFASGLFMFDARDESPATQQARTAVVDLYDKHMADLEPVAAALKAAGHGWYFLGKPHARSSDGSVRYWLNGHSGGVSKDGVRFRGQPRGWYTLEELRAEKFVDDQIEKDRTSR